MSRLSGALLVVTASTILFFSRRTVFHAQLNDEAQIRALEDRFAEAFKAQDVNGIMANYEHSPNLAVFHVVPRSEYLGWDAYRKDWEGFFAPIGVITLFEIKNLTVSVDGNLAYSYSFQHHLAKTKAGGSHDVTVRVTDVYRKSGGFGASFCARDVNYAAPRARFLELHGGAQKGKPKAMWGLGA